MKICKKFLTSLHRCYATGDIIVNGKKKAVVATEGEGACYAFGGDNFDIKEEIWSNPGGTMSIISLPGGNGEFLAVQDFFPTFQAENSKLVWARLIADNKWEIKPILELPYLHRFDVLPVNGIRYFIGATLCTSKKFKDDWSDPGKIYVGILPDDLNQAFSLTVIKDGLTKNHGYFRVVDGESMYALTASDEGVFKVVPPVSRESEWKVECILNRPVSDVSAVDIDGDGELELAIIEPFHGSCFKIYKKIDGSYREIYERDEKAEFYHVTWGGYLRGVPTFIGGLRRGSQELFCIQCEDSKAFTFKTITIDKKIGPSNVAVINEQDRDIIISANREVGEAAIYIVTD